MAGTLVANTINTDTGLFSTNNAYSGIAKAWVNFVGSSGAINQSFNVSSVTRNSTGNYTVNFTTAMSNANYVVVSGINRNNSAADAGGMNYFSQATGSFGISTNAPQGTLSDLTSASVAILGA